MKDKYLLSIGATLILFSFGIIIFFIASSSIDYDLESDNQTITFEQLNSASKKNVLNNSVVEQFKDVVGTAIDEVDEKVNTAINNTK